MIKKFIKLLIVLFLISVMNSIATDCDYLSIRELSEKGVLIKTKNLSEKIKEVYFHLPVSDEEKDQNVVRLVGEKKGEQLFDVQLFGNEFKELSTELYQFTVSEDFIDKLVLSVSITKSGSRKAYCVVLSQ